MSGDGCDIRGPCLDMDEYLRRTNPHYHDGYIVWGSLRARRCWYCGADLPDMVLRNWNWREYLPPLPPNDGAVDDDFPSPPEVHA